MCHFAGTGDIHPTFGIHLAPGTPRPAAKAFYITSRGTYFFKYEMGFENDWFWLVKSLFLWKFMYHFPGTGDIHPIFGIHLVP